MKLVPHATYAIRTYHGNYLSRHAANLSANAKKVGAKEKFIVARLL